MKERPILFAGPMVRAIFDGAKTQTRRVAKVTRCGVRVPALGFDPRPEATRCPYGQPGDRLWVRETWGYGFAAVYSRHDREGPFVYAADGNLIERTLDGRWRPSIHMPREASRLTLELTDVRVERLQDISRADAKAEGFLPSPFNGLEYSRGRSFGNANEAFRDTWEGINGAGTWDENPWVWVLEFRRAA